MKTGAILFLLFLLEPLFPEAQYNIPDSIKKQIHRIDSILLVMDQSDSFSAMHELHGNSPYVGDYSGQVFSDPGNKEIFKIDIKYFAGETIFYCRNKALLKIKDTDDFYLVHDAYYSNKGIKENEPYLIQKLLELRRIFDMVLLISISNDN